jgi:hypothetical protein
MMSRLDGVVRSKADGQLYVLEFKTAKSLDKRTLRQIRFDDQGIAQILAAEDRHKEAVAGELRMYLLKDEKRTDSDGRYRFASPLIRPYVMQGMTVADSDIQPLYDKPGGGRLGKAYRRQNIWEAGQIGVATWIGTLNARWPGILDERIVPLEPMLRTAEDRESWIVSTIEDETDRQFKAGMLRNDIAVGDLNAFQLNRQLQQMFPKRRKLCAYPSPCPFIGLCHEGMGLMLLSGNKPPSRIRTGQSPVRMVGELGWARPSLDGGSPNGAKYP